MAESTDPLADVGASVSWIILRRCSKQYDVPMSQDDGDRPFAVAVPIEIEGDYGHSRGVTTNIRSHGLSVVTTRPGRIGERVVLRFALPGLKEPLLLEAEVRDVRPSTGLHETAISEMTLKFTKLNLHAAAGIDAFLRRQP